MGVLLTIIVPPGVNVWPEITNWEPEIAVMGALSKVSTAAAVMGSWDRAMVSLLIISVNFYVQPWSMQKLRSYVVQVRTDLISQVLRPGHFSSPERGLTFHIRDRALNGDLMGLLVHDARKPEQVLSFLAERGRIVKVDDNAYLTMTNGHIHRREAEKDDGDHNDVHSRSVFD